MSSFHSMILQSSDWFLLENCRKVVENVLSIEKVSHFRFLCDLKLSTRRRAFVYKNVENFSQEKEVWSVFFYINIKVKLHKVNHLFKLNIENKIIKVNKKKSIPSDHQWTYFLRLHNPQKIPSIKSNKIRLLTLKKKALNKIFRL